MSNFRHPVILTDVTFVLHPKSQHFLIHVLLMYSSLRLSDLANLMNISVDILTSVLAKKSFLSNANAERLAKYFCIFCGNCSG